jgi:hypothetical protein
MDRRSWKVWVAGIALVQALIIGVDMALLWPSEAERAASRIRVGMTQDQVLAQLEGRGSVSEGQLLLRPLPWIWQFGDGSSLVVLIPISEGRLVVATIHTTPPVHPLARLRHTLARAFPFLGE